jgi:epoxyqueuosine reductase QueG
MGFEAGTFSASERKDPINIKGDFPHKTAATRAGLGWVSRNCLLITRKHGPWIRQGTVFTDLPLDCETPLKKSYCGTCKQCVEACPAGAIVGNQWILLNPLLMFFRFMVCLSDEPNYFSTRWNTNVPNIPSFNCSIILPL